MEHSAYKVVELTTVTDEELERVINEWVSKGWVLESIHFAMRESSKRPSMAFVMFVKGACAGGADLSSGID